MQALGSARHDLAGSGSAPSAGAWPLRAAGLAEREPRGGRFPGFWDEARPARIPGTRHCNPGK